MQPIKTGRKPAGRKPSDPEVLFGDLAKKSLVGIYLIQDGIFRYANSRMGRIFGYTVKEILNRRGPRDLVLPDDWPLVDKNISRRVSGKVRSINYEFRGVKKSGGIIDIEAYGYGTTYGGRPAVIGTLLDITRKKQSEHLLKQAEELYRGIFENAIEGIFQTTGDGRVIAANPALASMLGYDSPEEFLSSVTDLGHQQYVIPEVRQEFVALLERDGLLKGFECELYKKNEGTIWVVMNARVVRDDSGSVKFFEGTIQDITEQKKAEDSLRSLNEFNRAIIDNAPVAIFTLDRDGFFTSVNPALAALSGLGARAEEKLIGFNWLRNPYTIKCGLARHIALGLQGEPFQLWDFPFMNYRGDKNIYIDFNGVPLKGKNDEIEGLLCIIEETTDRVKTRAKLMQETRISAIGRLAAGAAHELNNPLATLVAFAEIAGDILESHRKDNEKLDIDKLAYCLDLVQQQAFRCKNVMADLLSLSRKDGLEIVDVELNTLIESVLESINFDTPGIMLATDLPPSLPSARVDTRALRQVLANVIHNAMDAVEGRLDAAIRICTYFSGNVLNVEIEDNGIGIPESIVEKIFEPFFTTKEAKKGIGLGLALCCEFLDSMKGTIRVESKPGSGTTFFLTLPAGDTRG